MTGYNVLRLIDGCSGNKLLTRDYLTLSECMALCEKYAECDNINFRVRLAITGECSLMHGSCSESITTASEALAYQRRGTFLEQIGWNNQFSCSLF